MFEFSNFLVSIQARKRIIKKILLPENMKKTPSKVKSLTSEATTSATQFFKRAYKISHFPGL